MHVCEVYTAVPTTRKIARLQDCPGSLGCILRVMLCPAGPTTRKIARLQDCPRSLGCNLAGGWSCRACHHPQDASKTPRAILQSCNLAGDGTIRSSSVSGVVHDPQDALKHLPRNLAILHSIGWYASTGTFGCLHDDTQSLHIQRRRRIANSTLRSECNSSARKALRIPNSVLRHPASSG